MRGAIWGNNNLLSGLILAGSVSIACAQSTTTVDMSGTVNDSKSGAAIAGATVTLANNPTLTTTTNNNGEFHLTGTATGVRAKSDMLKQGMSLSGTNLSFTVLENNAAVAIDVFNLKSEHVKTVLNQNVSSGKYSINVSSSELPGGLYFVRARVGAKSASFKITTTGLKGASGDLFQTALSNSSPLKKASADLIDDTIKVTKDGYRVTRKAITLYNTIYPLLMSPGLKPGNLSLISERNSNPAWGGIIANWGDQTVGVWDGGTQLKGDYKVSPFEGANSWMVTFQPTQTASAWGFVSTPNPEDMSAWIGGTMHIAVKGTVTSLGVTMASADQIAGMSHKVNIADPAYGYKPDGQWHDITIPLSAFTGTDLSQVNVYCGLAYPDETDTNAFSSSLFYQVDDIYWSIKK